MPAEALGTRRVGPEGPAAEITGVDPGAAVLRVLHLHGAGQTIDAHRLAAAERAIGWEAQLRVLGTALPAGAALRWPEADAVVLHGWVAGLLGRLMVRGRRTTVLVPGPGWCARPLRPVLERILATWANAVLVPDAVQAGRGVRRRVWVPPFVVGDRLDLELAAITRSHAFGAPSGRSPEPVTSPQGG
jgi:hypothetical protein